jgi:hypothetical protein
MGRGKLDKPMVPDAVPATWPASLPRQPYRVNRSVVNELAHFSGVQIR